MRFSRRKAPLYPVLRVTNKTAGILYVGIPSRDRNGTYLAPSGQTGDYIDLYGVDLADERIVGTVRKLAGSGAVIVSVVGDLYSSLSVTTTTTTTTTTSSP